MEGERLVGHSTEAHRMRFFFPGELRLLLAACGFDLIAHHAFPNVDEEPQTADWWACLVARARP